MMGGRRWRAAERLAHSAIPSIIMVNVRALANKMDDLEVLTRSQTEFREYSIMCFDVTRLHKHIPVSSVTIDGFLTVEADRDNRKSGQPVTEDAV